MSPAPPIDPVALVGSVLGFSLILVGLTRAWFWTRPLARIERQAARGDRAGAIAALEARVHRRSVWARLDRPTQGYERAILGILEGQRDRWAEALGWFERAEEINPTDPIHRANQGHARMMLGQVDPGLAQVRQALADLAPQTIDPPTLAGLWLDLAVLLHDLRRSNDAAAALDEAEAAVRRCAWARPRVRKSLQFQITSLRRRLGSGPLAGPNQSC